MSAEEIGVQTMCYFLGFVFIIIVCWYSFARHWQWLKNAWEWLWRKVVHYWRIVRAGPVDFAQVS
jgi:hypothetical protein